MHCVDLLRKLKSQFFKIYKKNIPFEINSLHPNFISNEQQE